MFFFFKQKTAYEMRISDWSSDVCSSDLEGDGVDVEQQRLPGAIVDAALADRHRADGVAVIAVFEDENAAARLADVEPVTERHFERDIADARARVREADARERIRREWDQRNGERRGGNGWVRSGRIECAA